MPNPARGLGIQVFPAHPSADKPHYVKSTTAYSISDYSPLTPPDKDWRITATFGSSRPRRRQSLARASRRLGLQPFPIYARSEPRRRTRRHVRNAGRRWSSLARDRRCRKSQVLPRRTRQRSMAALVVRARPLPWSIFDVADRITEALVRAGFMIQRRDRLAQCSGTRADLGPTVVQIEGPLHRSVCRPVCVVAECRIATLLEHAGPNSEIVTPARLLGGVRRCG
jgi:hypothetical protein